MYQCRFFSHNKCTTLVGDVDNGRLCTCGNGIYRNSVISAQYLCLNVIRYSTATCPKLKVSSKTPPLTSLAPSTFLDFINDLIIYLKSKISFSLFLLYPSNLLVTIFYWIQFWIPLSNQPPYFHFPGNVLKGFFPLVLSSSILPSSLPSRKQSH